MDSAEAEVPQLAAKVKELAESLQSNEQVSACQKARKGLLCTGNLLLAFLILTIMQESLATDNVSKPCSFLMLSPISRHLPKYRV